MAGILRLGDNQENRATQNFGSLANMQRGRDQTNEELERAENNERLQSTLNGAATGAMVGGPVGAGIGAAIGFAVSYFN